jgi:acetyl-CoA synthetase
MADPKHPELEDLLREDRTFAPPADFQARAHVTDQSIYAEAERDPEAFWARLAGELEWSRDWDQVLDWQPPHAKWFVGGKLNASVNCLDRHVRGARRNKAALVWEGEPGDRRTLTYFDLYRQVSAFANVLKGLGIKKGDRVGMYLPLVPELVISMLACARIGAIHSVVFGGFSAESLRDRMNDMKASLLITADGGYRRGQIVPLKQVADEAVADVPSIKKVVVVQRGGGDMSVPLKEGRDHWYHRLMQDAPLKCDAEPMDAEDMLYILYTSGTTGKPKGIVHTTGGYLVGTYATAKLVFDFREDDVYWCTADIGWVTGHSYVVYGPLANGATVFMYEGAPDWPQKDRFWALIERYGVTILCTAPTGFARSCGGERSGRAATISRRRACSDRSVSRSIPRRGFGTTKNALGKNHEAAAARHRRRQGARRHDHAGRLGRRGEAEGELRGRVRVGGSSGNLQVTIYN